MPVGQPRRGLRQNQCLQQKNAQAARERNGRVSVVSGNLEVALAAGVGAVAANRLDTVRGGGFAGLGAVLLAVGADTATAVVGAFLGVGHGLGSPGGHVSRRQ